MAWNEQEYLAANPDVAAAVKSGAIKSGSEHYAKYGANENRFLTTRQANNYASVNPDVAAAVDAGVFSSASEHYSQYGQNENRKMAPDPEPTRSRISAPRPTRVTAEQTSQHQLEKMLSSNSPLMKRAATQGQQVAASRGLLNSSMASGASQGAMIDRATPFAQQDAQTHFQNSQANANRQQQAYMSDLQYRQQLGLSQQQYGFQTGLNQQQYGFDMNRLQASSTANAWGVMSNNITDIVAQSMDAINNIQSNSNITADNKASMIEQILDMRDTDIAFQSSLYESLSGYLADTGLFPNL